MRRLRYQVATSLDGFIAASDGSYDWLTHDPSIDFAALFAQFDAFVMGRRTFEVVCAQGNGSVTLGGQVIVASRTLRPADHPGVEIVGDRLLERVAAMKDAEGKDIWLFGGGNLFRSLLDADLVDAVELAVMPILLGKGIPFVVPGERRAMLRLTGHRALQSGIVMLEYAVTR